MTPLQEHPVHLLLIASHFICCSQEEGLRVFFRPFLIVQLGTGFDMDGYLGVTPPKPHALLWIYAKP
ncbi:MAG: hypothetical protein WAL98_22360 [Desulfatiglandaceae bacterium]|jgi:hypothetical protein